MCSITRLYKIRVGIYDSFPTTSLRNASKFPCRTNPKCQIIMILIQNALFFQSSVSYEKNGTQTSIPYSEFGKNRQFHDG